MTHPVRRSIAVRSTALKDSDHLDRDTPRKRRDLDDIAGTWKADKAVEAALEAQDKVDARRSGKQLTFARLAHRHRPPSRRSAR